MGSSLLYISIAYYMQKGGGWVQIACKNCVRTKWKAPMYTSWPCVHVYIYLHMAIWFQILDALGVIAVTFPKLRR